ncbi:uncharacterized protein N7511_000299 [Penicillium nucicola]|uniref:uncharacterized protein n=1 Tax=Penicillium nucicola TaxID=1850975 RepID=UPI0025458185|nr:uncharacterized protein N7511_000299 [Penicillium nucicola]KAJ5775288.1 hypothetical protein N7511_000299 [Penicillium nucicola]
MPMGMLIVNGQNLWESDQWSQLSCWVNVKFDRWEYTWGDDQLLDLVIARIESGKATISSEALHHKKACTLSLRVPWNSNDTGDSIALAAIQLAKRYQDEVLAGKTRLDRIYLFRWLNEQR